MLTPYLLVDTLILISVVLYALHKYISRTHNYWESRKILYIEPKPFFGNFFDIALFRTTIGEYLASLYNQTKEPFFGIYVFDKPHLVIRDPELVKSILVRDFNYFDNRTVATANHDELSSNMLFLNKNPEWKLTRVKMTPIFTSGKLKNMVPLINEAAERMKNYIDKKIPHFSLEAKEIVAKFSTDVIAICAFGINAHSFENENAEFRQIGREIFDYKLSTAIQQTSFFFLPGLVNIFKMRLISKRVSSFLRNAFWTTIKHRENNQKCGFGKPNDMIQAIVDLQIDEEFNKNIKFVGDKVVAQAAQFFVAGFETTSSTIAFALYELCIHPHIQNKLRDEIRASYQQHGGFTYDSIQDMKYLDMVVCETLRKYPVLPFLDRKCNADYKIPGSDKVIEKGTPVYIPMFGLHYDENYFPQPHKFNPERFAEKNINQVAQFTYIPFGKGPRNCIGERFGLLGTKLGLVHVLFNFEVERSADTPLPLVFEPRSFVLASKVGLPMKFRRIMTKAA